MKRPLLFCKRALALAAGLALAAKAVRADDPAVPGAGFSASRYEALWTKSPFSVATPEEAVDSSPDYLLVGFANVEGVSYASLIDVHNQDHFLISTDKPVKGLTLTSITVGHNGADTYAKAQKDGQLITLKLEQAPAMAAAASPNQPGALPMPGLMTPQITMPGAENSYNRSARPFIPRVRRPPISVPPMPAPTQPQPVSAHPTPPPPR